MVFTAQRAELSNRIGDLETARFEMRHSSTDNLRILVVDDDKVDRMSLSRVLRASEYDNALSEATDADMALRMIEDVAFDCIFVDYDLPGTNGLELISIVRDRGIHTPIIALTGQGNEETAVKIMKAGASDYLTKGKLSTAVVDLAMRGAFRVHQAEMIAIRVNLDLREKNILLEQQNKELEKQRRHIHIQNLQLQEVSRLKSEFLATMSHELRTPLNAIIGFSQILMSGSKGELNEAQARMNSRVLANGENLLALINDILDFSKIEAGRLVLEPENLNLPLLVEKTVDELQSLATQKDLPVQVALNLENPAVTNDAVRVRQILVNLLSNAIKFTDCGGVKVSVCEADSVEPSAVELSAVEPNVIRPSATDSDIHKDSVVITVEDTGCGIEQQSMGSIFDPFHQADQRLTRKHGGTGLGLAIVSSLVNMMRGQICVDSELGQGTTVSVIIPRNVTVEESS